MEAPKTIATPTTTPIDSLASLYSLINGTTTTAVGGTQTKTESSSVSQDAMNEMLKSALAGSSGLAAVAGGQRTAGGYGSSTNQLLVNDLLTRTASQIAANNSTKTTTITTPSTTTTQGGITGSGTAKVTALLGLAKQLDGTETGNWLKKSLNLGGGTGGTEATNAQDVGVTANDFSTSSADSLSLGANPSSANSFDLSAGALSSGLTQEASPSPTEGSSDNLVDIGIDPGSVSAPAAMEEDPLAFLQDFGMADGGQVKVKKSGVLSTSQYNTATEAVNASQEGGYNAATGTDSGTDSGISVSADQKVVSSNGAETGSTGGFNSGFSSEAKGLVSDAGAIARTIGTLTKNSDLGMVGTVLGIAGSDNPLASAGLTAANLATSGLAGAAFGLAKNPSVGSVVDIASALANPLVGVANTVLGLAGENSIGKAVDNARRYSAENVPISIAEAFNPVTQLGTPGTSVEARMASAMSGDAMDNMMSVTGAFGTARDVGENSQSLAENANSLPGDALGNMMSQTNSFGTGDSTGDSTGGMGGGGYNSGGGFGQNSGRDDGGWGGGSGGFGTGPGSGSNGGLADGSLVRAPGDGTTDTKNVPLANGEYVLPADVVKAIGVDKLDALKAKYHVPVAVQKLQKYARG